MRNPFEEQKVDKRPDFLSVLLVLTFVVSGLSILSHLMVLLNYEGLYTIYDSEELPSYMEQFREDILNMLDTGKGFFLLSALFNIVSVIGAAHMWKLKRMGFHMYTVSKILLIILPAFFANADGFGIGAFFFTGLFIGLYAIHYKYLRP